MSTTTQTTTIAAELHGYRKGYERLKEELAEKDTALAAYENISARQSAAIARLVAEVADLKEQLRVKGTGVPFAEPEPAKPDQHWCEVGEHHVNKEDMWPNFGDCQECCTEDEYLDNCTEADYRKYTSQ